MDRFYAQAQRQAAAHNVAMAKQQGTMMAAANKAAGLLAGAGIGRGAANWVTEFADMERRLTRVQVTTGATVAEMEKVRPAARALADSLALPFEEVVGGIESLAAQGNLSLEQIMKQLPQIAEMAQASGASVADVANTAGGLQSNLKIKAEDLGKSFDLMMKASQTGMVEARDMALELPGLLALAGSAGYEGTEGLKRVLAMLETTRQGTSTASEAANQLINVLQKWGSDEVVKNFEEMAPALGNVRDSLGEVAKSGGDVVSALADLAVQATGGDLTKLPQLFSDQQMLRGMATMIEQSPRLNERLRIMGKSAGTVRSALDQILRDPKADVQRMINEFDKLKEATVGMFMGSGVTTFMRDLQGLMGELQTLAGIFEKIGSGNWRGALHDIRQGVIDQFSDQAKSPRAMEGEALATEGSAARAAADALARAKAEQERIDRAMRDAAAAEQSNRPHIGGPGAILPGGANDPEVLRRQEEERWNAERGIAPDNRKLTPDKYLVPPTPAPAAPFQYNPGADPFSFPTDQQTSGLTPGVMPASFQQSDAATRSERAMWERVLDQTKRTRATRTRAAEGIMQAGLRPDSGQMGPGGFYMGDGGGEGPHWGGPNRPHTDGGRIWGGPGQGVGGGSGGGRPYSGFEPSAPPAPGSRAGGARAASGGPLDMPTEAQGGGGRPGAGAAGVNRGFLDYVAQREGTADQPGGGYNTSLGYGKFTGGEKDLSNMTLDEIDKLQTGMLNHPQNNLNSSALGRYQIVRKTLRGLRDKHGLKGDEKFSPELQDRLANDLAQARGRDPRGLGNEWASLAGRPSSEVLGAWDQGAEASATQSAGITPGADGPRAPVTYTNQNATRDDPITPELMDKLQRGVAQVYGPGYSAQVYSGGQDEKGHGHKRTGSTRHDRGKAADVYISDPQGNRIKGDALAPMAQHWLAQKQGGVGMEMQGGGIHLDQHTERHPNWDYGSLTKAQSRAVKQGLAGIPPKYAQPATEATAARQPQPKPTPSTAPEAPSHREAEDGALAKWQQARADMEKPIRMKVEAPEPPPRLAPNMRRRSGRRAQSRDIRESRWNSYSDIGAA